MRENHTTMLQLKTKTNLHINYDEENCFIESLMIKLINKWTNPTQDLCILTSNNYYSYKEINYSL